MILAFYYCFYNLFSDNDCGFMSTNRQFSIAIQCLPFQGDGTTFLNKKFRNARPRHQFGVSSNPVGCAKSPAVPLAVQGQAENRRPP
jgi:hypothetical protein